MPITLQEIINLGFDSTQASHILTQIQNTIQNCMSSEEAWQALSKKFLSTKYPFALHLFLFSTCYPSWQTNPISAPAWIPNENEIIKTNIARFMSKLDFKNIKDFHQWSVSYYEIFWEKIIEELSIVFKKNPQKICDLTHGIESPNWLPESKLNISDSCFTAPSSQIAIIYEDAHRHLIRLSFSDLNQLANRIANSLVAQGLKKGDAIAIVMPMNHYAVAIYLGIIKMGGIVISIADSFSSQEIETRLMIGHAKIIMTQDFIPWGEKKLPLYEKICLCKRIGISTVIVVSLDETIPISLHHNDIAWNIFLVTQNEFKSVACDPMDACNILFSSGTTGTPKAVIWNHTTPIKAASDAYFHQNIQANDICTWPSNLGWMMGPWLIFSAFINHASMAIYSGSPNERKFGEFIQNAKVTLLGVVPTLVSSWRETGCMEKLDWSEIKVFSSTGESSHPEDMLYLMSLANYKPIIEYCGGTEIGGAYISSTVIENNYPSLFSTPTMGLNMTLIDEYGKPSSIGEVAIIPPSIGLSTTILNANHHDIYFENMPVLNGNILRRHGDQLQQLADGHYMALGRMDDTMNLSGIKISSVEIERALTGISDISETAAIAISQNGPSHLIIYAVTHAILNKELVLTEMQNKINSRLNPLFKIYDIVFVNELPKTASNKIMRRILRSKYLKDIDPVDN